MAIYNICEKNKKTQGRKKKKALGEERCTEKELGWPLTTSKITLLDFGEVGSDSVNSDTLGCD